MREPIVASKLEAKPVEWLWGRHFPKGEICIVAGKPDQGKGMFAAYLAAEVTKQGGNVLYSAAEDDPARMTRPRLEAAGAKLDQILVWQFRLPLMWKQLVQRIKDNDISLVVMDPMASHLTGGIKRHSDNIRVVTDPMRELMTETGVTFLIIEHALKRVAKSAEPLAMIGGSGSGLPAAARAAYLFGKDPKDGDRRLLCPVKLNIAEWPKSLAFETDVVELEKTVAPVLLPQGETEDGAGLLLEKSGEHGEPGRPPDKRTAASEWLVVYLYKRGPTQAKAVIEDARQRGITTRTLKRAADDVGIVRKPPGGGRKCTWELSAKWKRAMDRAKKESKGGKK